MIKKIIAAGLLFWCAIPAFAQSCEGGLYLNPQVIRGEGASQTESAVKELIEFMQPTGLPVLPVLNIRETQDVRLAIKKPVPPCWVYGNPVVGLASGYRPVAINTEPIQSAVLILADVGKEKDGKPVDLSTLPPDQQAKVLAKLKTITCYGMKSGVTTSLVKAQGLCGTISEVMPTAGLGQSYLPTKAAFAWTADKWVGLITRVQGARSSTMKSHYGTDERIHMAQLIVVPATHPSWGYGLYLHPDVPQAVAAKAASRFTSLKSASPTLLKTLDLGAKYEFTSLSDAAVAAMKKVLAD